MRLNGRDTKAVETVIQFAIQMAGAVFEYEGIVQRLHVDALGCSQGICYLSNNMQGIPQASSNARETDGG